jgi:hypothetical protein
MKARKLPDSSALSDVRCSTSSQTTASAGEPDAWTLGGTRGVGDRGLDRLQRDRSAPLEPRAAQVLDDHAGILPRHVGEDEIAVGPRGGARDADDVDDRRRRVQEVERVLGQVGRHHEAQVHQCDAGLRPAAGLVAHARQ